MKQVTPQNLKKDINTLSNSNLATMANFIGLRQEQKEEITQKNSLSKFIKNNTKKTTENRSKNPISQDFFDTLNLLDKQLQEGHTILTITHIDIEKKQRYETLQNQGLLTILAGNQTNHPVNTPLVLRLLPNHKTAVIWLHRQWFAENQLAKKLLNIAQRPIEHLDNSQSADNLNTETLNPIKKREREGDKIENLNAPNQQQQIAIDNANTFSLSIITGGPGTGKTFTVAKLVTHLQHQYQQKKQKQPFLPPLSIALTAPTGKAAQRMQESLLKSLDGEKIELDDAKTLHRLLGISQNGLQKYHSDNPLPYDLVIVDEASMLGLELASLLVDAIKPTARLILLGDANQLSAVDAGSVLSDICQVPQLQPYRTQLTESKRFGDSSKVGIFASIVNTQWDKSVDRKFFNQRKIDKIHDLLTLNDFSDKEIDNNQLNFFPISLHTEYKKVYDKLAESYSEFFELMKQWYNSPVDMHQAENRKALFAIFDKYRILTAGHQGLLGSKTINQKLINIYKLLSNVTKFDAGFFHGLPIMITKNDYQLGLFNGDIGICIFIKNELWVCFADKVIASSRLSRESCEPAYAMTIHKSQGSEFDKVAVCLDRVHQRLLSQALIYTAITRSKGALMIISEKAVLDRAIIQQGNRQTGLALQFY